MLVRVGLGNELYRSFKTLTERLCVLLRKEGIRIDPYHGDGPLHFAKLNPNDQAAVFRRLETYCQVCEETVKAGQSIKDEARMLWRMFRKLRVHPDSGLMRAIESGDVIEIYNHDFIQIFRNLAFFSICSYTLDDLLSRPFWELFLREPPTTETLVNVCKDVLGGRIGGIHQWTVPVHPVIEADSTARNHMTMEEKIISPLHDRDGRVICFVNTCRILTCVPTTNTRQTAKIETGSDSKRRERR